MKKIKLLLTPLIIVFIIHIGFYVSLKSFFKTHQSPNPKATTYFLHGMTIYTSWITGLHEIAHIDYGSPLMKPFLSVQKYFFEKGKSLIAKDSIEDVMWWMQNYGNIYAFRPDNKEFNSLQIQKLPIPKQQSIRNRLYNYITRLEEYQGKELYLKDYYTEPMSMKKLIWAYLYNLDDMYEGESFQKRIEKLSQDKKMTQNLKNIYDISVSFYEKYPSKNKDYFDYIRYKHLETILMSTMFRQKEFIKNDCTSHYMKDYLSTFYSLLNWVKEPHTIKNVMEQKMAEDFRKYALSNDKEHISTHILTEIDYSCKQQHNVEKLLKLKLGDK